MKYEVEYASFRTVIFEADSQEEAIDKVAVMEDLKVKAIQEDIQSGMDQNK